MSAYAATSDLVDWIDFDTDSTVDNALLGDLITRASGVINSYCGRNFDNASDLTASARLFDASTDVMGLTLWLDRDLASPASDLTITNGDGTSVANTTVVTLPSDGPPYYALKAKASSSTPWTYDSDPEQSISVTGTWTYQALTPDPIKQACLRLAQWFYKQRSSDSVSDQPVVMASGLTIMPAKLPADVLSMLEPYRYLRMGAA